MALNEFMLLGATDTIATGYTLPGTTGILERPGVDYSLSLERPAFAPPRLPMGDNVASDNTVHTVGDSEGLPSPLVIGGEIQQTDERALRILLKTLREKIHSASFLVRRDQRSSTPMDLYLPIAGIQRWHPIQHPLNLTFRASWAATLLVLDSEWRTDIVAGAATVYYPL